MKFLNEILVFFGVLILIITTLLIPFAALGFSVQDLIFDKKNAYDLLETQFLDEDFLVDMRWEVSEEVIDILEDESTFDQTLASSMDLMDKKTRKGLLEDVLTDKQIEKIFEDLFDETYDWYAKNSKEPEFIIELSDILNDIYDDRYDIAETLLEDLPDCNSDEIQKNLVYFSREPSYRYEPPACQMTSPYDGVQVQYFGDIIGEGLIDSIDEMDVTPTDVDFKGIKSDIKDYRTFLTYGWIVGLSLWAVGCLFVARSWHGLRRSLGQPALYGGLLTLLIGATFRWLPNLFADNLLNNTVDQLDTAISEAVFMELPSLFSESMIDFAYGVLAALSTQLFIYGGALFIFGLLLALIGMLVKPRPTQQAPAQMPPAQATPPAPAQAMAPPPAAEAPPATIEDASVPPPPEDEKTFKD